MNIIPVANNKSIFSISMSKVKVKGPNWNRNIKKKQQKKCSRIFSSVMMVHSLSLSQWLSQKGYEKHLEGKQSLFEIRLQYIVLIFFLVVIQEMKEDHTLEKSPQRKIILCVSCRRQTFCLFLIHSRLFLAFIFQWPTGNKLVEDFRSQLLNTFTA